MNARRVYAWLGAAGSCVVLACSDDGRLRNDLPEFNGPALSVGGALCVSGPYSSKAAGLESAAILAEEYVNGSVRAFPELAVDDIPCRQSNSCGVWAGRSASGEVLRGPLRVIVGDTQTQVDTAVDIAQELKATENVPVMVGPCTVDEMLAIQGQVTTTETVLITPVVTADSISLIDDRTAVDKANTPDPLPGYVYRLLSPDYVLMRLTAHIAGNVLKSGTNTIENPLLRYEDQTEDECTAEPAGDSYCVAGHGASYACKASIRSPIVEKDYYQASDFSCSEQADCEKPQIGANHDCVRGVCTRFRAKKYCTQVTQPKTAIFLYEDSSFGRSLRDEVNAYWVGVRSKLAVASAAFDPRQPASFPGLVADLFNTAATGVAQEIAAGNLPAGYTLADSVVFLLAQSTEAALLMQEWQIQLAQLPPGSESVFWVGVDSVRSKLIADLVGLHGLRNLFVIDPYSLGPNGGSFARLYEKRWGHPPAQYAGSTFDAILLAALANERAGARRAAAASGELAPNRAVDIKNSLEPVSHGCVTPTPGALCSNAAVSFEYDNIAAAMTALARGSEIAFYGATGGLALSPAGDVVTSASLWKVAVDGDKRGFFITKDKIVPSNFSISLDH